MRKNCRTTASPQHQIHNKSTDRVSQPIAASKPGSNTASFTAVTAVISRYISTVSFSVQLCLVICGNWVVVASVNSIPPGHICTWPGHAFSAVINIHLTGSRATNLYRVSRLHRDVRDSLRPVHATERRAAVTVTYVLDTSRDVLRRPIKSSSVLLV